MSRTCRVAAVLAVSLLGAAARAQPAAPPEPANLRGDSPQTRKRLAEADQKVIGGKAADAVDDLQRILDEAGDDLITVDGKQYRPARWVAHQILAKLPPDVLKAYRDRVDEPARKLLGAGKQDRDPRPLWQLLDRYFVSRPAEEGLILLGDLLFERGEFRTAELLWRRLVPDANPDVAYPAPTAHPAAVRARVVLAVIFQGESDRAREELAAFRTKYPDAAGAFAGKTGKYADTLQGFLDAPPRFPPAGVGDASWPTFGGDPGRSGRAHGRVPVYWPGKPTWTVTIPSPVLGRPGLPPARPPFGHPVIADGRVYVSDGLQVFGYDLRTGKLPTVHGVPRFGAATGREGDPQACAALVVSGGRLYTRLGPGAIRPPESPRPGALAPGEAALASFDLRGDDAAGKELWRVKPLAAEGKPPGVWEGAPLVANGRMWAALARFEGGRVAHAVAGFDPADPVTAPDRPAWVAELADSPVPAGPEAVRTRQELLTLAGRNVVLCTNAGAVVAVDAATGRRAWAFRYPRAAKRLVDAYRSPDPAPAAAHGGRVFVAPADADRVYALDAETGALLWESGPTEGAQIVGVARGRVVVTTTGPVKGIRGLGVTNGSYHAPDGWIQADGGGVLGYGRGFVTDAAVVWPSRAGLWFLDPETGRPHTDPMRTLFPDRQSFLFGNAAYADGVLVVVTPTHVWGYVATAKPPDRPEPDGEPRRPRFEALVDAAEERLAAGDVASARVSLLRAARGDLPDRWRGWAAARLLLTTPPTDDFNKLPADVRDGLHDELRDQWVITPDGGLATLDTLIGRHTGRESPRGTLPSALATAARRADAPSLSADACVSRFTRLPPAAVPLRPIPGALAPPGFVFAATPSEVTAVPLQPGEPTTHAAADTFTHAADIYEGFVAAGPHAVAVYSLGSREPQWVFRVPDTDRLPDRPGRVVVRTDDAPAVPHLSSFVLAGSWLFARLGEHHLFALDLKARRVAWVLGAHGRPGYEPVLFPTAPRFEPRFSVTGRLILAQLSDGRRWMVQASTGRVCDRTGAAVGNPVPPDHGERTARVPWVHPPVEVDSNRVAFSDGPGLVRFYSLTTGRVKTVFAAEGEPSLAGDPPQVRGWGDAVLVAVRRNHGVELDRVELLDGKPVWPGGSVFFDAPRVDLRAADADPQRVYVPVGGKLYAHRLDDGKAVWEAELPDTHGAGGWVVRAGPKVVVAYPEAAVPAEPVAGVVDRAARSFRREPLGWRLPRLAATVYDSWTDRTVPVLLLDPESGKVLKQLEAPARGPFVTAWFEGDLAVVATGDRVAWVR